jgi:hypothetical protein
MSENPASPPPAVEQETQEGNLWGEPRGVAANTVPRQMRLCVICGARVRNINPKVNTCGPLCTAKKHGQPSPPERPVELCIHCGVPCGDDEGCVCNDCYSQYTPGMLADLEG